MDTPQALPLSLPLHLARLAPSQDLHFLVEEDCIVFGGLIQESPDFCRMLEKDYWKKGACNGAILKASAPIAPELQALTVPVGKTRVWVPDEEALDGIDATALYMSGIGEVTWKGALGSKENPLEAVIQRNGVTYGEGQQWIWRHAVDTLMREVSPQEQARVQAARIEAAHTYGKAVLETAAQLRRGDVYGVVVYAAPINGKHRIEELDFEEWEVVGRGYALKALSAAIQEVAKASHDYTIEARVPAKRNPRSLI